MSSKFKRKKLATTIHGVEVYTPTPNQRNRLKEQLGKANSAIVKEVGDNLLALVNQGIEITDQLSQSVRMEAMRNSVSLIEKHQAEWYTLFTNIDPEDIEDDVLKDPSQELVDIGNAIYEFIIKPINKELQKVFDEATEQYGEKIIKDLEKKLGD